MSAIDLSTALQELASAHGPAALAAAHRRLQRATHARRKASQHPELKLARAVEDAIQIRDAQRAAGVTGEALARGLEDVVRQVWPVKREWKYLCASCLDTGLEILICHDGKTCGLAKGQKHEAPHEYGVPCWCSKGARFRVKTRQTEDDVIAAAAKVSRPKRFGER